MKAVDMLLYLHIPYFSDHKAYLKTFKIESVPYDTVYLMYGSGCAFSCRTNFMW